MELRRLLIILEFNDNTAFLNRLRFIVTMDQITLSKSEHKTKRCMTRSQIFSGTDVQANFLGADEGSLLLFEGPEQTTFPSAVRHFARSLHAVDL